MKSLLAFILAGLPICTFSAELDQIQLITPISYSRPSSFRQSIFSSIKVGVGDAIGTNILNEVSKQIAPYKNDLKVYYPKAGELDLLVNTVVQDGIKKYLTKNGKTNLTDSGLVSFYGHLGNNLIGKIADKILDSEGVKDPARRSLWVEKITYPFNDCMIRAMNSQYDANHCINALTASLVPSAGVGLVYELARSNLNSTLSQESRTPFNLNLVKLFKTCLERTDSSASDVKSCALDSMRVGVKQVAEQTLDKTLVEKASNAKNASIIKTAAWPMFGACSDKVGLNASDKTPYADQFIGCVDLLMESAGSMLVSDKISTTPAITSLLKPFEVSALAKEKSSQFKKCVENLKAKNIRKDGLLDISSCENQITNEVIYKVVSLTLKENADKSFKDNKTAAQKAANDGIAILNGCWNNNNTSDKREACLKTTILAFAKNTATLKLNELIPSSMPGKANLTKNSVGELNSCLEKELPRNISESEDMNEKISLCTSKLTKSVALPVAEYQIRASAEGNVPKSETDKIVKLLVQDQFSKCLGNAPSEELLDKCSEEITIKAGKAITDYGFRQEVLNYIAKAGGVKALNITQQNVDKFIKDLTVSTHGCMDQKTADVVVDRVNACVKNSIKKIAFYFGDLEFSKSVGNMYAGKDAERMAVEKQFKSALDKCLSAKDKKDFSVTDYTKNLYVCADSVAKSTSLIVGKAQIESALDQYLKDRPRLNLAEVRDSIRKSVLSKFETCMSKNPSQAQCIDDLKRDANQAIVLNYGRAEVMAQLNTRETPSKLRPIEDAFVTCTNKKLSGDELSLNLDECNKNFALGFAKELGELKLNYLLKQVLGSSEFNNQKHYIDDIINKYNSCLSGLSKYGMNEGLTDKLTICTSELESQGLRLVKSSMNNWMTSEQKDAATIMIKEEFANFLPCLSALLPSSPYNQKLQDNVDSALKPVAVLLAQFIDYNPENAKRTLDTIIKQLSTDLSDVAAQDKARRDLVDLLYTSGSLDQLLKAMVRGTVKDAFKELSEKDLPLEIRDALLAKQTFEDIFNTPEGGRIKDAVMEIILKPMLIEGAEMSSPRITANMEAVKDKVIKLLISAPNFGEKILRAGVQTQINDMGGVTKFFAKILYSESALNWDNVRLSAEGKAAEDYIRDNILAPKFRGEKRSPDEEKAISKKAEELVTKAVKNYKKK